MILVSAEDDFPKNLKILKISFFVKNHKNLPLAKCPVFGILSSQPNGFVITTHFNSIKKTALNAYFLQKVDFCIFEPKNREPIENSSKAPLNCSPFKCTYLGKISFQYHKRLVRKVKMKNCHLELRFIVYVIVEYVCQCVCILFNMTV